MTGRVTGYVLVLMLAGSGASAQDHDVIIYRADPDGQVAAGVRAMKIEMVDVLMAEPFETGEPVTGAPYTADVITEIVQPLADGNRIERRTTSSVARDGQGRTRRTQRLAAIGPILPQGDVEIVTINDPVAGLHYSLDTARKVAVRSPPMFTKRIETPPIAAAPLGRTLSLQRGSAGAQTESLGTRTIDGVEVHGTRTTTTIPAGEIGNQAPIHIVSERWHSPELRVVVASRRSDPRFGETNYRLENLVRSEPPAELFQVPGDFTIETGKPFGVPVP
jgi:hypothetical protein